MTTWLVTGCSTGLGRSLAEGVIGAGHNAVVTARDVAKVADLADGAPERVLALSLDVTNPDHVTSATRQAEERFGSIDVLVNNAGYGYRAAVEEGDDAEVRALFETHFFGTVAMIKAVLPGMRERRGGAIVNISSIGAQLTPVGSGYYSAAKAAIEGMSGALRGELAPLGISVTVVEPGAFCTDFAGRSLIQSATVIDDYAATAGRRRKENDTPPRPVPRSSRPSNRRSRPDFCSSAPTPWPRIATSRTRGRARSGSGKSSPAPPISTPEPSAREPRIASLPRRRLFSSVERHTRSLAIKGD